MSHRTVKDVELKISILIYSSPVVPKCDNDQ